MFARLNSVRYLRQSLALHLCNPVLVVLILWTSARPSIMCVQLLFSE
jgi:hypothetical protein